MTKVAVVTVTYNTAEDTKTLLESLEKVKTSGFALEIIIVDNGSKEPFVLGKEAEKDTIFLTRIIPNIGFTGGYNTGMKIALEKGADYVMIVNNDTVIDQNLIANLLQKLQSDPNIGLTVPKIYFAKGHEFHKDRYRKEELGKVFWYAGGWTDWANVKSIHRGIDEVDHGQYDKTEEVKFATGCCMMFPRAVLEKVGLLDERYFLYYEDADLNERVRRAGYTIYYVPTALLVHVNAASTGGAGNVLHDYFLTRNQMLFGMTYAPLRTKIALIRQSLRLFFTGRPFQKLGVIDYYLRRFNKGTFSKVLEKSKKN